MTPTQEFARSVKTWVVCLKTIIIEELSNQGNIGLRMGVHFTV